MTRAAEEERHEGDGEERRALSGLGWACRNQHGKDVMTGEAEGVIRV
jgi:hypothetical protein